MGRVHGRRPGIPQRLFPSPSKKMIGTQINADFQDVIMTKPLNPSLFQVVGDAHV